MNGADEISQAERRRIMAEDRRARNTYWSQAQEADLELGGRYAKVTAPCQYRIYPQQPATSPWHHDPVPSGIFGRGNGTGWGDA